MPSHIRKQVREKVAQVLGGLTSTGSRVYQSRVKPLSDAQLPCLLVFTLQDDTDHKSLGYPRLVQRGLSVAVTALVKASDDFDDKLDQVCLEVEKAIAADVSLGGLVDDIRLLQTLIQFDGEGEKPVARAEMLWRVDVDVIENAPDVAI